MTHQRETLRVRPADGRLVRDPETLERLPEAGAEVPRTTYWLRRLRCGDVIETPRGRKAPKE